MRHFFSSSPCFPYFIPWYFLFGDPHSKGKTFSQWSVSFLKKKDLKCHRLSGSTAGLITPSHPLWPYCVKHCHTFHQVEWYTTKSTFFYQSKQETIHFYSIHTPTRFDSDAVVAGRKIWVSVIQEQIKAVSYLQYRVKRASVRQLSCVWDKTNFLVNRQHERKRPEKVSSHTLIFQYRNHSLLLPKKTIFYCFSFF